MYTDKFGYLPVTDKVTWSGGNLEPLPEFKTAKEQVESRRAPDGYLYPPIECSVRLTSDGSYENIPGSDRPALLHKLPASHLLQLNGVSGDPEKIRKGVGGFVMHFAAFLFGHRCNFGDWWVDGRVSIKSQSDFFFTSISDVSVCIERAIRTWSGWTERMQRVSINALFLHNRNHMYHWDWERFQSEYTVLDAAYRIANAFYGVNARKHEERIDALCSNFNLAQDSGRISRIVSLRNDLIHEGLWDGGMPGEARSDDAFMASFDLSHFCSRVFVRLLGIETDYIHSDWWSRGSRLLRPK